MDTITEDLLALASGPKGRIMLTRACKRKLEGATGKQREQFAAYAEQAVANGFEELPPEQFRFEKRVSTGGARSKDVAVFAFKPWKLRIYGAFVDGPKGRTFIATEILEKKRDRVEPDVLKRAARLITPYL